MDYKLCKELYNNGLRWKKLDFLGFPFEELDPEKHMPCLPTLEELIEACGNGFMNLRKVWDENGNITNFIAEGDHSTDILAIGKTPSEAVAKLWLELNKD